VAGYLLLIPLIGASGWQRFRQLEAINKANIERIEENNRRVFEEIDSAIDPKDLQFRLKALNGPTVPDSLLNLPLAQLQQQAQNIYRQGTAYAINQSTKNLYESIRPVRVQSIKLAITSLVCAFCFSTVSWVSRVNLSLFQLFLLLTRGIAKALRP